MPKNSPRPESAPLIKTERKRKSKIPLSVLERQNLHFSLYKNRTSKVTPWWVRAHERNKMAFFVLFILSEGIYFDICILSQCVVYQIQLQNIHTFTYKKTLLHTLFCLFLKSPNAFSDQNDKTRNSKFYNLRIIGY